MECFTIIKIRSSGLEARFLIKVNTLTSTALRNSWVRKVRPTYFSHVCSWSNCFPLRLFVSFWIFKEFWFLVSDLRAAKGEPIQERNDNLACKIELCLNLN